MPPTRKLRQPIEDWQKNSTPMPAPKMISTLKLFRQLTANLFFDSQSITQPDKGFDALLGLL